MQPVKLLTFFRKGFATKNIEERNPAHLLNKTEREIGNQNFNLYFA